MAEKKYKKRDEERFKAAISIVDRERVNWEDAVCYVTDRVGFRMRQLIRIFRKNFWGVFDEPIDRQTGREKVWIGLVQSIVETWVKNIDLDQKDIGFIARHPGGYDITELTRLCVRDYLDRIYFGETLDSDERQVLIDGTVVWKTWEDHSSGKLVMKRRTVDLLNFYIDPTEENIQSAYRVTERALYLPDQIKAMTGWFNTDLDDVPGTQTLNRNDGNRNSTFGNRTTGEYRDVWEMWGKIPRWLVTGDKKAEDAMEEVDGHVIISGLEAPNPVCHLIEENTRKDKFGTILKPYEEWRACKISGRWYGLGVAERIIALQEYLNTIVNIRINRGYISQLGLFKIKKGKGITAQMLNRLPVNGAIQVTDMDDIEQMNVSEVGQSSYNDEDVIKYWSQQITSAMPISNGDIMPASASATANTLASTSAKSAYTMFKEGTGAFLERWIDRGALPIIAKTVNSGDIIRLTNEDDRFKELVETIAINNVAEALEKGNVIPTAEELMATIETEKERLRKSPQIFIKNVQQVIADALDTKVKVTNEDLDTSVTVQNLMTMLQIAPEYKDDILRQIYDLIGLNPPKHQNAQPGLTPGAPQPQQVQPMPTMQGIQQGA